MKALLLLLVERICLYRKSAYSLAPPYPAFIKPMQHFMKYSQRRIRSVY